MGDWGTWLAWGLGVCVKLCVFPLMCAMCLVRASLPRMSPRHPHKSPRHPPTHPVREECAPESDVGVIIFHPWARIGGCMDDAVVMSLCRCASAACSSCCGPGSGTL